MKFDPSITQTRYDSPLGPMIVAATRRGLAGVWFEGQRHLPDTSRWPVDDAHPVLRQAVAQTQEELAATLGVGQDTISRLEKRSDMLLSTLRRYVEAMGGKLELVAKFPDRPPLVIEHLADETSARRAVSAQVKAHA